MNPVGLPIEDRQMILDILGEVRERLLTPEKLRDWDRDETFPETEIRELLGPEIGLQLLFIPEEYGGMGGGARDVAAFSEGMANICLGVGTAFLAIHLGADPILVGATPEQKEKWLTKLAEEGSIVAYAATEAEAGSNLANLKTTANPVNDETGNLTGYILNGNKQFISNGGYADFLTVLAQTPDGPSFFIVEKGTPGFTPGKSEDKHGIRSSNTSPLNFDEVFVPLENLVGGVPGQGLVQANEVFGYTRLMVACCGLGAGMATLEKAINYAKERVQFGSPLIEKQGYTHKLITPFVAQLEAARAYIEEVALRLDSGENDLQVEGAIAKLFATEVANSCADAAIQALGGYGYTREYEVEKIKRDVKITTIYEGTSEIQQMIISTSRPRSRGDIYDPIITDLGTICQNHSGLKAEVLAALARLTKNLFIETRKAKLNRQQHVSFRLAMLTTLLETSVALTKKAALALENTENMKSLGSADKTERLRLSACANTALVAQEAYAIAGEILFGSGHWSAKEAQALLNEISFDYAASQSGLLQDMDGLVASL